MAALPLTPSSADQSVDLIGQIFGSNWQHLLDGGASGGGGGATQTIIPNGGSLFGDMFLVANSIALAIAGLLIVYTVVVGAMSTAHEGESLGRRFHTLWAPVRSAFAIALLMPLAGGYSLLQAGILYFASMGIGVADNVQEKAMTYIASTQGVIVTPPTSRVDNLANGALKSLVCQTYLNKQSANYALPALIERKDTTTSYGAIISFDGANGSGYGAGACGSIVISCSRDDISTGATDRATVQALTKPICEAQKAATSDLLTLLQPVADSIVKDEMPTPNQIQDAVNQYTRALNGGISDAVSSADTVRSAQIAQFTARAINEGWASLGSWYWTISRLNQQIANAAKNLPFYRGIGAPYTDADMGPYLSAVDNYIQTHGGTNDMPGVSQAQAGTEDNPGDTMMANVAQFVTGIDLNHVLDGGKDPIAELQSVGNTMVDSVGLAIGAVAASKMISKLSKASKEADAVAKGEGGLTGKLVSGIASILGGVVSMIPILLVVVVAMLSIGIMLAYYLPSVPFILWTLGVVGYLILLVESLVAAPLWAIGHAIPEGEGMAGQHGKQGYMLFLNVIARPTLMVFGYFAAILILWGVAGFIGQSFQVFTAGLQAETATGIFAFLALTGVLSGLMVAVAHMAFGLIHEVPDRVLRWIGGGGAQLGESGGEHKANQQFVAVGGFGSHATDAVTKPHMTRGMLDTKGGAHPVAPTSAGTTPEQAFQTGEAKGNATAPAAAAADPKSTKMKQEDGASTQDYGGADEAKHQPKDR